MVYLKMSENDGSLLKFRTHMTIITPQQPKRKADSLLWTGWKPPRDAWKIMGTQ
jgi:hypothetical protein